MLMRVMRWVVATMTVLTTVAFVVVVITTAITTDRTLPIIKVEDGILEVSVNATEEELLQGISAYDEKDGDISSRLLVESISKFTEIGYCKVTYAVCDFDNHVTTATRQIHYTDYSPPTFRMTRPLVFSIYDPLNFIGTVEAEDCIDGDISKNVIIYSPDFKERESGNFTLQASVTNSKGDTASIELPIIVDEALVDGVKIILTDYLVYFKAGDPVPDWTTFVYEKVDSNGLESNFPLTIRTNFNKDVPGIYTVNYYGTDDGVHRGRTALIVVVE